MACTEREGEGRKRKAFGEDMSGSGVSKRERQGEGESCRVEKPEREFDGVCQKRKAAKTGVYRASGVRQAVPGGGCGILSA